MGGLGTEFHQEGGRANHLVRVAVDGVALAVQMGLAVGHSVHQFAAFLFQLDGNRLAGQAADFHQELVGSGHAHGGIQNHDFLAVLGDELGCLFAAVFLEHDGGLGMQAGNHFFLGGAAGVHAELAIGRCVPVAGRVAEDVDPDAEQVEYAADFLHVADDKAVKAGDEVDALIGHAHQGLGGLGLAVPEVAQHAHQRIVVAGDVAADKGGGVGKGHVKLFGDAALLLAGLDEGVDVIANHFGHAGGGDGNHVRLVQAVGVGQAVDHIVQAAEHGCVFRHRRGHTRSGLLEMARKVRAVVGHAALAAVHKTQGLGKAVGHIHGAQWLASLGRVHHQRIAGEVLGLVVFGLGPLDDGLDLVVGVVELEFFLVGEHRLILGLTKQQFVVDDFVSGLGHGWLLKIRLSVSGVGSSFPRRLGQSPDG